MAKKQRFTAYLPQRLYNVVKEIEPLFRDFDSPNPRHGSFSRALAYIVQYYMGCEDYVQKKVYQTKLDDKLLAYFIHKDREKVQRILEGETDG